MLSVRCFAFTYQAENQVLTRSLAVVASDGWRGTERPCIRASPSQPSGRSRLGGEGSARSDGGRKWRGKRKKERRREREPPAKAAGPVRTKPGHELHEPLVAKRG